MRIIGVIRVSDAFAEYCHDTVGLASQFCDGMCFLTNNVTRSEVLAAMARCSNLLATRETQPPWSHPQSMREAYELGVSQNADWVVIPDHDEILPYDHLHAAIEQADSLGKMVITFPFVNCWGSPLAVVAPSLNCTGDHGKVFKRGIQDFKESGFCVPDGYWDSISASPYPLRHCNMMTELLRERRIIEREGLEPWAMYEPKTFPFVPNWTIHDYHQEELRRARRLKENCGEW